MLNNLFKRPTYVRMEQGAYNRHIATIKGESKVLADMRVKKAEAELEAVLEEHTQAVNRELKATELLHRALTQLGKVDPRRTGGKPMGQAISDIFNDAKKQGLWGEAKE
ncbi:MAG TPA: hypothetical protein VKU38_03705 [Ktedonobacteraceae bacterium]|nr:hypothetical protein [Ktedonobacteraceae bacterium]